MSRTAGRPRRPVSTGHLLVLLAFFLLALLLLGATGAATSALTVPMTSVDQVVVPAAPLPAAPAEDPAGAP